MGKLLLCQINSRNAANSSMQRLHQDLVLGKNGYFVLRFLAEDVGKRLDTVLDAILRTLSHRCKQWTAISNESTIVLTFVTFMACTICVGPMPQKNSHRLSQSVLQKKMRHRYIQTTMQYVKNCPQNEKTVESVYVPSFLSAKNNWVFMCVGHVVSS